MEKEFLKDLFFIGSDEEIEALVAGLKARCLKATNKVLDDGQGHIEKLIFNTENQTYISQTMEEYKECPHCGRLEKVANFKTLPLVSRAWYKKPGSRLYTKEVTVCGTCATEAFKEDFLERGSYMPAEKAAKVYTNEGVKACWKGSQPSGTVCLAKVNGLSVANATCVLTGDYAKVDFEEIFAVHGERGRVYTLLSADFEEALEKGLLEECSSCHQLWLKKLLRDEGKCPECTDMRIWGYHDWPERRTFKHTEGEAVTPQTLYFGTEVETVGPKTNACLVSPCKDVFHLERDGSLPAESFEIISQPMTWEFIEANKGRIEQVFNNLVDAGQKSHETTQCGFHVHVSRDALDGERAIKRILAIVHGMKASMKKFARRDSQRWASFKEGFDGKNFTEAEIDAIDTFGHSVAVNLGNTSSQKNTVEFRIFKGTLNMTTYLATIQFVKNIVAKANSNDVIVRFNDLLEGEYIEQYIQQQAQYRDLHSDEYVNFAQCILGKKIGEFSLSHTKEEFTEIIHCLSAIGGFGEVQIVFHDVDSEETSESSDSEDSSTVEEIPELFDETEDEEGGAE